MAVPKKTYDEQNLGLPTGSLNAPPAAYANYGPAKPKPTAPAAPDVAGKYLQSMAWGGKGPTKQDRSNYGYLFGGGNGTAGPQKAMNNMSPEKGRGMLQQQSLLAMGLPKDYQVLARFGGSPVVTSSTQKPMMGGNTMFAANGYAANRNSSPDSVVRATQNTPPAGTLPPGYGAWGAGGTYGAAGAAPGAGAGTASDIGKQLTDLLGKSNDANDERYRQLLDNQQGAKNEQLGMLGSQWDQIFSMAGKDGTAPQLEREKRQTDAEMGAMTQNVVGRGLNNTTITDSLARGIQDDSALRQSEIMERDRQSNIALRQAYTGQALPVLDNLNSQTQGIIERRTDAQPDLGMYMQLLQQAGATQGQAAAPVAGGQMYPGGVNPYGAYGGYGGYGGVSIGLRGPKNAGTSLTRPAGSGGAPRAYNSDKEMADYWNWRRGQNLNQGYQPPSQAGFRP